MNTKDINILLQALKAGTISRKDHRRLELAALDDPFLFDALEGYNSYSAAKGQDSKLLARIDNRIHADKKSRIAYWIPLVAALFVGVLGFVFLFDQPSSKIQKEIPVLADNGSSITEGTGGDFQVELPEVISINSGLELDKLNSKSISPTKKQEVQVESKKSKRSTQNETTSSESIIAENLTSNQDDILVSAKSDINANTDNETSNVAESESIEADEYTNFKEAHSHDSILATSSGLISKGKTEIFESSAVSKKSKPSTEMTDFETRSIKGVVLDSDGIPLIGANIMYGQNGVISDFDGSFTIEIDTSIDILEINYTGYEDKFIDLTNEDLGFAIVITLDEGAMLDEVVVTGLNKRIEDWTAFDKKMRNAATPDLFLYGVKDQYDCSFTFRFTIFGKIKDVEIINTSHPIMNDKVEGWIESAKAEIPSRKGKNIERSIIIYN